MQFFFFVIWRNDNYPWWNNKLVLALISQGVWGYLQYIVLFYLLILGFSLLTLLLLPTPITTPPSTILVIHSEIHVLLIASAFTPHAHLLSLDFVAIYTEIFFIPTWSWQRTGRPSVLWFMGSQKVGHDWATELNCMDSECILFLSSFWALCVCFWKTCSFQLSVKVLF